MTEEQKKNTEKKTEEKNSKKEKTEEKEKEKTEVNSVKPISMEKVTNLLSNMMKKFKKKRSENVEFQGSAPTIEEICERLKKGEFKNVLIMCGAGISVSAGIPDFRSSDGLYKQLDGFELPYPEAIFDISYFKEKPEPFFRLAKNLYPGNFVPTKTHYFFKLLEQKGILQRVFTQNIDTLERVSGLSSDKILEAHGSFGEATCQSCGAKYDHLEIKSTILKGEVPRCKKCKTGVVKPDIVFFGESLPEKFWDLKKKDFPKADLLIVIGTSLVVQPFSTLIYDVKDECPRLLINREVVGKYREKSAYSVLYGGSSGGFKFGRKDNTRDLKLIGDADEGIQKLVDLCGWTEEFEEILKHRKEIITKIKKKEEEKTENKEKKEKKVKETEKEKEKEKEKENIEKENTEKDNKNEKEKEKEKKKEKKQTEEQN
ncbi:nad-dependent protein deacetylase sirtuin-2 [Anaeramoeba flamelloides]|uniref:NAD-dependent protein deacetylase n=1 Tax=Anaeramoeba flamelloides TaxID=1746091 RepID=A0AAV7YHQ2_9EUKA|nr:nad-dependent protein deacetylase sirtuin-2 [Anaeramoeba flamelloides]